jgi:hypothetical protein
LPIFTIHDNIVTTVGNQEYVSSVIKDEMTRLIGAEPGLSIEYLHPQKSWDAIYEMEAKLQRQAA